MSSQNVLLHFIPLTSFLLSRIYYFKGFSFSAKISKLWRNKLSLKSYSPLIIGYYPIFKLENVKSSGFSGTYSIFILYPNLTGFCYLGWLILFGYTGYCFPLTLEELIFLLLLLLGFYIQIDSEQIFKTGI